MTTSRPSIPLPQLVYKRVKKFHADLEKKVHVKCADLDVEIGPLHSVFVSVQDALEDAYEPIFSGDVFSPATEGPYKEFPWKQRWFKMDVPAAQPEQKGLRYLQWQAHGESTIYINGQPWAGLDCCHPDAPLPDEACTLYLDCGLWQTGIWGGYAPPDHHGFRFEHAKLVVRDPMNWKVYHDVDVLKKLVEQFYADEGILPKFNFGLSEPMHEINPVFRRLIYRLSQALDVHDLEGLEALSVNLDQIYADFKTDPLLGEVAYVGHAHIDLVWLWPERASYKKGIHTFATQLRLMDKYPDYTFTMSQPPLYYHLLENEPEQAKEIAKRMQEGRWEFTGGLEVEADTQIPVGEGLARSLIYGQERIEAVRGEKSTTVWIPDVFGYSQCLPQLFALAGIKNFYTTKILWTEVSRFPHNSFVWKSPDGSEVLTHLAVSGYNCEVNVKELAEGGRKYQQSDVHHEMLCAAGFGDGGGGSTEGHCERAQRLSNLSGVPKSKWSTVEGFFDRLETKRSELPHYRGELYLEFHRGVQTSQSDFKFNLRAAEKALQTREAFRVILGGEPLAADEWLRYLFAHFHDAIPGSSINTVYAELNPELRGICQHQLKQSEVEWGTGDSAKGYTVVNPLALDRTVELCLPLPAEGASYSVKGTAVAHQVLETEEGKKACIALSMKGLESLELQTVSGTGVSNSSSTLVATPLSLENGRVKAEWDKGQLSSLCIDGVQQALTETAGFWLHIDEPEAFDAWDIDHPATWLGKAVAQEMDLEVVEAGPVRATLKGTCSIGDGSQLVVYYRLGVDSDRVEVECHVDWHEDHRWLRYRVATDYRGSVARFGAPFGSVDRSQVEGLPSQEAMWEVPASRWASVLDGRGQGLSIVTEAKYGFSAKEGVLSLSLLRSPTDPDPVCDRGEHVIRFSIGAHHDETNDRSLSTAAQADAAYTPAVILPGLSTHETPFHLTDLGSVVPAWVMPSRSDSGYLIRFHEVAGARQTIGLQLNEKVQSIQVVDLNESCLHQLAVGGEMVSVEVLPHQILTVKVIRSS